MSTVGEAPAVFLCQKVGEKTCLSEQAREGLIFMLRKCRKVHQSAAEKAAGKDNECSQKL